MRFTKSIDRNHMAMNLARCSMNTRKMWTAANDLPKAGLSLQTNGCLPFGAWGRDIEAHALPTTALTGKAYPTLTPQHNSGSDWAYLWAELKKGSTCKPSGRSTFSISLSLRGTVNRSFTYQNGISIG